MVDNRSESLNNFAFNVIKMTSHLFHKTILMCMQFDVLSLTIDSLNKSLYEYILNKTNLKSTSIILMLKCKSNMENPSCLEMSRNKKNDSLVKRIFD